MASKDPVLLVQRIVPPQANGATIDTIDGGSTPAESVPVYDFDATTAEYIDLVGFCNPHYDGTSSIKVTLPWSASATAGGANQVRWEVAVRRIVADAEDINAAHTYSYQGVSDAPPSAIGEVVYPTVTLTNAQADGIQPSEKFIMRARRLTTHADDAMAGDAELHADEVYAEVP